VNLPGAGTANAAEPAKPITDMAYFLGLFNQYLEEEKRKANLK
jgi:hypothetical protein